MDVADRGVVGGVGVSLDAPVRDTYTGLDLPAGTQVLDGVSALAAVRSRHTEVLTDATWTTLSEADGAAHGRDGADLEETGWHRTLGSH